MVLLAAHEGDGQTLGAESASTSDTVQVRAGISRQIVVDSQVDTLNVDTTTEDVGGDADSLLKSLELLETLDTAKKLDNRSATDSDADSLPLFLIDTRVYCDGWEVTFSQELVQLGCAVRAPDENDDLVELQIIKQVVEASVLLTLL